MKIGIITLYDNNNYGNKLQNFALQKVLSDEFKIESETFKNNLKNVTPNFKDYHINNNKIRGTAKYFAHSLDKSFNIKKISELEKIRINNIKKFDKLINKSDFKIDNNFAEILDSFDMFVIGSDQVWNPNYILNYAFNLGKFIPENRKVAYAASFGISNFNDKVRDEYKKGFKSFTSGSIGVREEQAKKDIHELTGLNAEIVLDPTMLVPKEEWLKISREPYNKPKNKFLLTYILGDLSEERISFIKNTAKKLNLEIVNLMDPKSDAYTSGVEEFLWYFNDAELILADSFHAGVFSILFEKNFYILNREDSNNSMNSRFETLLKTFDLKDRFIKKYNLDFNENVINYNQVNNILKHKKEKSLSFLRNNIER